VRYKEAADRLGEPAGFVLDLPPGAVGHTPAGKLQALFPATVVEECHVGVVELAAVGFDDQRSVAPEEVGLEIVAADSKGHIDLRSRQLGPGAHSQELALHVTAGPPRLRVDFIKHHSQPSDATAASAALDQRPDRALVEHSLDLRLPDRLTQLPNRFDSGEIQQHSRHACAADSVHLRPVGGHQRFIPVRGDPPRRAPTPTGGRDVDSSTPVLPDPQEIRRRPMREHRIRPTSQHRRHVPRLPGQRHVADGICPVVGPMQPSRPHSLSYARTAQPLPPELLKRNKPMLPTSDPRNRKVRWLMGRNRDYASRNRPIGGLFVVMRRHVRSLTSGGA
jgi:hypothetical protein